MQIKTGKFLAFFCWIGVDLRLKSKRFLFVRLGFWRLGPAPAKLSLF